MIAERIFLGAFLFAAMLPGCSPSEDDPRSCLNDFDCLFNEICEGASGGAEGACATAATDATRVFGATTLDFAAGDEVFLLGVYSVPTGASVPVDTASFTLTDAGATARVSSALPLKVAARPDPSAVARSRFDAVRWQRVHERGAEFASSPGTVSRAALQAATCPECDADTMCWGGECVAQATLTFTDGSSAIDCILADVVDAGGQQINVLVDEAIAGQAAAAVSVVESFGTTLAAEQTLLGVSDEVATLDRNGDGRLTVVFTNYEAGDVTTDVVGFFDDQDFLAAGTSGATGNEADLLWVRMPGASNSAGPVTDLLAVGTLAHEYVHLASYATRVAAHPSAPRQEVLWLDEGIAHLVEDLTGWGPSNVGAVWVALSEWPTAAFATSEDSVAQRGQAYLLLRHLVDQAAADAGAANAASTATANAAATLVGGLLAESAQGFEHARLRDAGAEGLWHWLQAVYASGRDGVLPAAEAYNYLPVAASATTDNMMGIATTGTFSSARGVDDVLLDGPTMGDGSTDEIFVGSGSVDSVVTLSGSVLFLVQASTPGVVELRAEGPAHVDLQLRAVQVE